MAGKATGKPAGKPAGDKPSKELIEQQRAMANGALERFVAQKQMMPGIWQSNLTDRIGGRLPQCPNSAEYPFAYTVADYNSLFDERMKQSGQQITFTQMAIQAAAEMMFRHGLITAVTKDKFKYMVIYGYLFTGILVAKNKHTGETCLVTLAEPNPGMKLPVPSPTYADTWAKVIKSADRFKKSFAEGAIQVIRLDLQGDEANSKPGNYQEYIKPTVPKSRLPIDEYDWFPYEGILQFNQWIMNSINNPNQPPLLVQMVEKNKRGKTRTKWRCVTKNPAYLTHLYTKAHTEELLRNKTLEYKPAIVLPIFGASKYGLGLTAVNSTDVRKVFTVFAPTQDEVKKMQATGRKQPLAFGEAYLKVLIDKNHVDNNGMLVQAPNGKAVLDFQDYLAPVDSAPGFLLRRVSDLNQEQVNALCELLTDKEAANGQNYTKDELVGYINRSKPYSVYRAMKDSGAVDMRRFHTLKKTAVEIGTGEDLLKGKTLTAEELRNMLKTDAYTVVIQTRGGRPETAVVTNSEAILKRQYTEKTYAAWESVGVRLKKIKAKLATSTKGIGLEPFRKACISASLHSLHDTITDRYAYFAVWFMSRYGGLKAVNTDDLEKACAAFRIHNVGAKAVVPKEFDLFMALTESHTGSHGLFNPQDVINICMRMMQMDGHTPSVYDLSHKDDNAKIDKYDLFLRVLYTCPLTNGSFKASDIMKVVEEMQDVAKGSKRGMENPDVVTCRRLTCDKGNTSTPPDYYISVDVKNLVRIERYSAQ